MSYCAGCDSRHGDSEPCLPSREELQFKIDSMQAEIDKLVDAVSFYANPNSYGEDIRYSVLIQDDDIEEINEKQCGGKRARKALEGSDE